MATFSIQGSRPQYFSFPPDVIKLVLKNISSPDLFQKLIQTCKYFYSKKRVVVYKRGIMYDKHTSKWAISPSMIPESKAYQLWLKKELCCETYNVSIAVSQLLQKVYKCTFESLYLKRQQLTFDEYLLLTSSKTIRNIRMTYMTICYQDGSHVPFDKLMEQLLCVFYCEFFPSSNHESYFTAETAKNLLQLPIFTKMRTLELYRISECFDYRSFCEFIKKNSIFINNKRNFWHHYEIVFYYKTSTKYRADFEKAVEEMLNEWHPANEKPKVLLS